MKPNPVLEDVADAILDGTAVDWNGVDSSADPADQPVLEQLKTLAALRLVARRPDSPAGARETYWGHLRVVERIGQGAFGEVFRAWDTRLDREVALKLLPADTAGNSPTSAIIEEGRLLARVRHPNVVTIYGAERIDGRAGLWMELVAGRTLEQALRDGTTFAPAEVARIGGELCRAVAAVHGAGLLHRDIKAQNVMAADDGRLVLMDFGTGRELSASDANVTGTPLCLAPEVLAGGAATTRSDVYSIGVLLYHLLTGSYPVQARDVAGLRRAHTAREQTDLPNGGREIPQRLRSVIARALDPNPDRRYASADSLGDALRTLDRAPVRRPIAYAMAAGVAIMIAAGALWQFGPAAASDPISAPVIAVMPFTNLSPEPDSSDYFVDGLTSEVIRNLCCIDGLEVRSQTSSFSFKNKARDLQMIGRQLNANHIVEGDVLRVGNRLRINVQLVQIAGDVPLWTRRFDATLDDVFAIQDEISTAIVNELRLTLGTGQRRYRTNVKAYDLYLRGRMLLERQRPVQGAEAAKVFEQVIALDRTFAPAHAGLVDAYNEMSWPIGGGILLEEGLAGMRSAAVEALRLDHQLAEAHAAMGVTHARERDWANASRSFEHALTLNPTLTRIHATYADTVLIPLGETSRALQLLEAALRSDPRSLILRREQAFVQFVAGLNDVAIANKRQILTEDPDQSYQLIARALVAAGKPAEAIAVWENRPPTSGDWERWITGAYVQEKRQADVDRLVETHRNERAFRQALIYAGLGDKYRTFEALNRAVDVDPHRVAFTLACPEMAFLRGDPRYHALRLRLNLPVQREPQPRNPR